MVGIELSGTFPIKLITRKRKKRDNKINLAKLELIEEKSKSRTADLREEKRLEIEK